MKEGLTCIISDEKVEVNVDRETGEIDIFDNHLKLNIREKKANLVEIENSKEILICAGYQV